MHFGICEMGPLVITTLESLLLYCIHKDGRYEAVEMKPTSDLPGCGQDDSSQHDSRPDDTTGVKAVEIISESSGEDEPDYDETVSKLISVKSSGANTGIFRENICH